MSLDRYILRQCLAPFLVALIAVTAVVWITQALQRADLMIAHGQNTLAFLRLSVLIIPSLLAIVIPFALFAGSLYALHRLHGDSEIAVLFAAGVGRMRIAAPFLLVAAGGAAAMLWINLDLMPRSYRLLKSEVMAIRADIAKFVVRSGEFATLPGGFTFYAEEALAEGRFVGLFLSDYRDPERRATYMARRALLQDGPSGTVLQLVDGNIQTRSDDGRIEIVEFERTTVNLDRLGVMPGTDRVLEPTERFLGELLSPDLSQDWERRNARALAAEAHGRLAAPLHAFAMVLIALAALVAGAYQRGRYAARIALACLGAGLLKAASVVAIDAAAHTGLYALPYLPPALAIVALFGFLVFARPSPKSQAAG